MPYTLINVPGTFNNCFFHCLAAYHLLNEKALPEGLYDLKEGRAGEITSMFAAQSELDNFLASVHDETIHPPSQPIFIIEKVLILGVLLRQFYANQLRLHSEKIESEQKAEADFNDAFEAIRCLNEDAGLSVKEAIEAAAGQKGVIIDAHRAYFLEYFNKKDSVVLSPKEYWDKNAHEKYIGSLAKGEKKLSFADVTPFLEMLKLPCAISDASDGNYHEDALLKGNQFRIASEEADPTGQFEIVLRGDEGHYYLRVPEGPKAVAFIEAIENYKTHREQILARTMTLETAQESALYIDGFLPESYDYLPQTPISRFITRIKAHRNEKVLAPSLLHIKTASNVALDESAQHRFINLKNAIQADTVKQFIIINNAKLDAKIHIKIQELLALDDDAEVNKALYTLLGKEDDGVNACLERDIKERIKAKFRTDLMACDTTDNVMQFDRKYEFLQLGRTENTRAFVNYQSELLNSCERQFKAILRSDQMTRGLRQTFQALEDQLQDDALSTSEAMAVYQLVINTFSPLLQEKIDIPLFEQRLAGFQSISKEVQGHSRPPLKILGAVMIALGIAAGIALAVGTFGLGVGIAAMVGALVAGSGFFALSRQRGISKTIHKLVKTGQESIPLKDKLYLVIDDVKERQLQESVSGYYLTTDTISEATQLAEEINTKCHGTKIAARAYINDAKIHCVSLKGLSYNALLAIEKRMSESQVLSQVNTPN